MLELTTRTDFACPGCGKISVETKGILGGLMQQLLIHAGLTRLKEVGGTLTCNKCNITWEVEGNK